MTDTHEPGELFREIYSLPRLEQLRRIASETNDILTCDADSLDYRLSTLEYTLHVVRKVLWDEDSARIVAKNRLLHPVSLRPLPPSLDDLA